jgi:hypothetical protein
MIKQMNGLNHKVEQRIKHLFMSWGSEILFMLVSHCIEGLFAIV